MMNASGRSGEAAAPEPQAPPLPAEPAASITSRFIAGFLGVLLLAIVLSYSVARFALVGVAGCSFAWLALRARRRPYTRNAGWIGSVATTSATFVGILVVIAAFMPAGSLDKIMHDAAQQQAQQPRRQPPAFLRQLAPGVQPNPAADSLSRHMVQSRAFTLVTLGFVALIGSGMAGVVLGTLAWAMVTALLFAVFGRWTFGNPSTAPPA